MKRYLGIWSSANSPDLSACRWLTAGSGATAMRIVIRELQFRRMYSRHGSAWDTWAVLYQFDNTTTPTQLHAGSWSDR